MSRTYADRPEPVLVESQFLRFTGVTCSYCGARPGDPCLIAGGTEPSTYVHDKRQQAALAERSQRHDPPAWGAHA